MTKLIETIDTDKKVKHYEYVDSPDDCPFCHHAIEPIILTAFLENRHNHLQSGTKATVIFKCPRNECLNIFIRIYFVADPRVGEIFIGSDIFPVFPSEKEFSSQIINISSDFVQIYNHAFQAEQYGLDLIAGPGYRKSLEFLIKDYAIKKSNENDREMITHKLLGDVINQYIDDPRIQDISRRAIWLGNDETHYLRKWKDKDIQDVKTLINLTVNWIEIVELSESYKESMPDKYS